MEKNKAVIRRFAEEFKVKANVNVIEETHAASCVFHLPDPSATTRDAMKMLGGAIFKAFPDVKPVTEELLAIDDKVIERTSVTATHKGEFNGVPPTNRSVRWSELHIYRLKDGQVVEQWSEINMLGLLAQIGALPPPPARK
jgi:predicted ester cyclase